MLPVDKFSDIAGLSEERRYAINALAKAEIVKGIGGGLYGTDGDVSRVDMPLYVYRALHWVKLARDEAEDSTVFVMTFRPDNAMGGGSGWRRAPRVIITNRHVVETMYQDAETGQIKTRLNDYLVLAKGGWVRSNRGNPNPEPQLAVGVSNYPNALIDIAALVVPEELWVKYLDSREAAGLSREPRYMNPHIGRDVEPSDLVVNCGSPLMDDYTVTSGTVTRGERPKYAYGDAEYFTTDAGINPGNSGGLCMTFERDFAGMPTLKPFYRSPFGGYYVPADDMGYVLHRRALVGWEQNMAWWFAAAGITL